MNTQRRSKNTTAVKIGQRTLKVTFTDRHGHESAVTCTEPLRDLGVSLPLFCVARGVTSLYM